MDKLAENLQRLDEDDLLQVVQMIHDHKTADSYTKNDVEGKKKRSILNFHMEADPYPIAGEFHVDLYTLPDSLVRMLWEFSQERVGS